MNIMEPYLFVFGGIAHRVVWTDDILRCVEDQTEFCAPDSWHRLSCPDSLSPSCLKNPYEEDPLVLTALGMVRQAGDANGDWGEEDLDLWRHPDFP